MPYAYLLSSSSHPLRPKVPPPRNQCKKELNKMCKTIPNDVDIINSTALNRLLFLENMKHVSNLQNSSHKNKLAQNVSE